MTPQVGLLGGSFDPVHRVHIALARAARDALGLEYVELLPAARPWQRGRLGATPEHRLRMLELACAGDPGLRVNPIELHRAGDTYTIDTLAALPATARYTWILGSDQLANFHTWHRWRELLQHVRLAVAERPGTSATPPPELAQALAPGGLVRIPFTPQPVSATAIRRDLAAGRPVDALLDPRVLDYIRTHRLYLDPETP
ncbi:Nicotinate-nucleotide adenylyltransferase [Castellaniella defragrans 65Phen]|uniref:Probable nicotinate-nucleotide adenylyltransferase n=1 Tax=Castellaniella defragrans (strain DSM 12143 / CCUG 39792 / 65Phen) TaxID=1437824 RepID=W8WZ74_CASD6|nr:Nicotinate-nucleotide adenylyltransferase [Castellaniella defragrans 65Phen]